MERADELPVAERAFVLQKGAVAPVLVEPHGRDGRPPHVVELREVDQAVERAAQPAQRVDTPPVEPLLALRAEQIVLLGVPRHRLPPLRAQQRLEVVGGTLLGHPAAHAPERKKPVVARYFDVSALLHPHVEPRAGESRSVGEQKQFARGSAADGVAEREAAADDRVAGDGPEQLPLLFHQPDDRAVRHVAQPALYQIFALGHLGRGGAAGREPSAEQKRRPSQVRFHVVIRWFSPI